MRANPCRRPAVRQACNVTDLHATLIDLAGVAMLLGLAPFEGIDVGIDRRSPVHWGVYQRHGAFPYSGQLWSVT